MRRTVSCFLVFLLLLSLLVSCKREDGPDTDGGTEDAGLGAYTIVRPEASNIGFSKFVTRFQKELLRTEGVDLAVTLDENAPGDREIIVGHTTRAESVSAMGEIASMGKDAYIIKNYGGKIVICGNCDDATIRAMKIFTVKGAEIYENDGYIEKGNVDLDSIFFEDSMIEYNIEFTTDVAIPEGKELLFSYETMIELRHNGEHNGTLIATYAGLFGKYDGYRIHKSTDRGNTWTQISTAVDDYSSIATNQIRMQDCALQPCLFELPCDMGDFKEGTLFLGATTRGENLLTQKQASAIMLYYSEDIGETWTCYHTLARGGSATSKTGVWEPFFIYEEESGRVYCFYSDESDATGTKNGAKAQEIVYRYTTDMKKWSKPKAVISFSDKENLRPGMCSITRLGNGKYYMTYELVGMAHNPVYAKTTASGRLDDWGDPSERGSMVKSVDGKTFGSAPWCAWSDTASDCGVLVVTAHHMPTGSAIKGATDIFLSFDYGETYIAIENPLYYSQIIEEEKHKCGYSAYLGFSKDGHTLYYMNSVNTDKTRTQSKVVFARIKIW